MGPDELADLGLVRLPGSGAQDRGTPELPLQLPGDTWDMPSDPNDINRGVAAPPVDDEPESVSLHIPDLDETLNPNGPAGPRFGSPLGQEEQRAPEPAPGPVTADGPALRPDSRHPVCGGEVTNECIVATSLVDENADGVADNAGVLLDDTVGAALVGPLVGPKMVGDLIVGDLIVGDLIVGDGSSGTTFAGAASPALTGRVPVGAAASDERVEDSVTSSPARSQPAPAPAAEPEPADEEGWSVPDWVPTPGEVAGGVLGAAGAVGGAALWLLTGGDGSLGGAMQ